MAEHEGQAEENRGVVSSTRRHPRSLNEGTKTRHEERTSQEKGDTRAAGPSVSLFLTSPLRVSSFS